MKKKITAGSFDLTTRDAEKLVNHYIAKSGKIKHRTFKHKILKKLEEILERGYRNEEGIKALAKLLVREVEVEVKIDSDGVRGKKYYCVKFAKGSFACDCNNFLTYGNVVRPKQNCKHIKLCIENGVF